MTNDANKSLDDYLAGDSVLSRRYREAGRDGPPEALDAAILADARAAVETQNNAQPIRGWRWIGPLSTAAVVVLAAALVLDIVVSPELRTPIAPPSAVEYSGRPSDTGSAGRSVQKREPGDEAVAQRLRPSKPAQPLAMPPLDIADVASDAVGEAENLAAPFPAPSAVVAGNAVSSRDDTFPNDVGPSGPAAAALSPDSSSRARNAQDPATPGAPSETEAVKSEAIVAPYPDALADAPRAPAAAVAPRDDESRVIDADLAAQAAPSPAAPAEPRTDERDNQEPVPDRGLRALRPRPAVQQAKPASLDRDGLTAREEASQGDDRDAPGPTAMQAAAMVLARLDTNPHLTDAERRDAALDEVRARHDVGDDTRALALLLAVLERWPDTDLPADFPLADPRR